MISQREGDSQSPFRVVINAGATSSGASLLPVPAVLCVIAGFTSSQEHEFNGGHGVSALGGKARFTANTDITGATY